MWSDLEYGFWTFDVFKKDYIIDSRDKNDRFIEQISISILAVIVLIIGLNYLYNRKFRKEKDEKLRDEIKDI